MTVEKFVDLWTMTMVLLLVLLFSLCGGFSNQFLQLTDLHMDQMYKVGSDVKGTSCHAHNGTARFLGERFFCDSPVTLVDKALNFVAQHSNPDFILLTGDFARHDDYAPIPRTWQEILDENTAVALKVSKLFPGMIILPSIGNNDVYPHDVMNPPGPNNTILSGLATAWDPLLDPYQRQQMLNGGWLSKKMDHGNMLISLNTLYFAYGPDCNQTGTPLEQLEWLGAMVAGAAASGGKVMISGHIPPDLWLPTCRKWYAQLCTSNPKTIRGQIFGHKHSDQFNFVGVDGVVNGPNLTPANSIAVQCAPSIVPSFNPSYRIWKYDPASFDLSDYDQFYADLDSLYAGEFKFVKEYSLLSGYGISGNLSNTEFWIRLNAMLKGNLTLSLQYLKFKFVSVASPPIKEIEARIGVKLE